MPKSSPNGNGKHMHTITIKFTEPEDLELYEWLEAGALTERRSLPIFALLALHKHQRT